MAFKVFVLSVRQLLNLYHNLYSMDTLTVAHSICKLDLDLVQTIDIDTVPISMVQTVYAMKLLNNTTALAARSNSSAKRQLSVNFQFIQQSTITKYRHCTIEQHTSVILQFST